MINAFAASALEPVVADDADGLSAAFAVLAQRTVAVRAEVDAGQASVPAIAVLHGFDLDDRPIVKGIAGLPGELVAARSTVALAQDAVGGQVVVVFERGELRAPIILGALLNPSPPPRRGADLPGTTVVKVDDGDRLVLRAEREIVLECGDASITLTRAGKVLIRGKYVLSQSSGYNRLKGAVIDIN
jgi:hypothetical protein